MHSRSFKTLVILAGLTLTVLVTSNMALAITIPPSAEPGIVIQNLKEKERPLSGIEAPVTVPKLDETTTASAKKIFVLKSVKLDMATAYTEGDFSGIYQKYIGEKVSFADLNAIARGMTRKYKEDGYIFSRVIVAPQKVANGIVRFQAIEGHITHVEIVGALGDNAGLLRKMADKMRSAGPANTKVIERYLLLINDLPGITARSFVKPSKTVGGGDLVVSIEEEKIESSVSFDSRGSRTLGPFRVEMVGAFNDTFGLHDRTTLRAIATTRTNEMKYGEVSHEEQIGSEGMRLKGRFAVTNTAPGGAISGLDIEGKSALFDLEALYPLIRKRQMNVNLIGNFNVLNSSSDVAGVNVAKDRMRHVRASVRLDFTDSLYGVNLFDLALTQGMKILNATNDGLGRSRGNGKHDFLRANLTATRIQDLWRDWSLSLSATGQATGDSLLASEEFTVGGGSFGRAYDGGEIAGDKGYAGLGELRFGKQADGEYLTSYQFYAFLDGGRVFNINPVVGENKDASLASAGIGVRFNLKHDFSGYVEVNTPLTRRVASENDKASRVFFSVLKRF